MRRLHGKHAFLFIAAIILAATSVAAKMDDISQMPGWPNSIQVNTTFWDMCGLVLADIDGDPDKEIIAATTAGKLIAWDYDGTLLFSANLTGLSVTVAAVGDVSGDSAPEIIVNTRDLTGGSPTPTIYIFSGAGTVLKSGTPSHIGAMMNAPTLADLSGDDKLELIIGEMGSGEGWLHVLDGDLNSIGKGWPAVLDHVPATSAAVGDLDDDGQPEVAVCSFYSIYAFEKDGSTMPGFPKAFTGETFSYSSPALADLNGDGTLEIITNTHGDSNRVHAVQYDGSELAGWPYDLGDAWSFSAPSVGDIDGNGDLEVVAGRSGGLMEDEALFVINHDGTDFGNFPLAMVGGSEGNFVLADLNGDSQQEIVFTTNTTDDGQGYLMAVDADAQQLAGWPLRPDGMTYMNGATLADVDGNGSPELGVFSSDPSSGTGWTNLYALDAAGLDTVEAH